MPYRSGLIQAAVGAIGAVAFLIANLTTSTGDPKQRRVTGILQKSDSQTIVVTEDSSRQHTINLGDETKIFLNDSVIPLEAVENGRKATVIFYKQKGVFTAKQIDVFPRYSDFPSIG
ncbi:MAG: hypothetical protein ACXW3Z_08655 [Limisphaerales bacterium]